MSSEQLVAERIGRHQHVGRRRHVDSMWIGRPSHPTAARQRGAITCSTVSRVERSEPELSEVNWGPARDGLRCSHYAATRPASGCATRRSPPDEPRASCRELTQLPSSRSAIFRYSSIFDFVPRTSRRRAPPALLRLRAHLTRRHPASRQRRALSALRSVSLSQVYSSDDRGQSDRYKPNSTALLSLLDGIPRDAVCYLNFNRTRN